MRLLGAGIGTSYAVQGVFTIVAAAVVVVVWRRNLSLPVRGAVLASATLIAVPLSLLYDMMIGAIAACWLLSDASRDGMWTWEKTALALIYAAMLDSRTLAEALSLPVNTICVLVLFGLAVRRAFPELRITLPSRVRVVAPTR
jgi:hypothetical protein